MPIPIGEATRSFDVSPASRVHPQADLDSAPDHHHEQRQMRLNNSVFPAASYRR